MGKLEDSVQRGIDAGNEARQAFLNMLSGQDNVGLGVRTVANALAALLTWVVAAVFLVFSTVFSVASELAAIFLQSMEGMTRDNQGATNSLIAATMTDLLDIEITGDDIPSGGGPAQQLARAQAIGGKLLELLESELSGKASAGDLDGRTAAKALVGFNINFSVRAALISIMTEFESLGFFKNFREIGEVMAESLGLGRLLRQAFHPLLNVLIVEPYTRQLNAQYRQTRMAVSDVVRAAAGGFIDDGDATQQLKDLGYRDSDIQALVNLHASRFGLTQLSLLVRHGVIADAGALTELRAQGYTQADSELLMQYFQLERADQLQQRLLSDSLTLAIARNMDETEFQQILQSVNISEGERQLWAQILSVNLAHPQKRLSFGQIVQLAEHNQVGLDYLDAWSVAEGYSEEDQLNLELLLKIKEQDFAAAAQRRADAAAAKAARAAAAAAKAAAKGKA